MARLRLTRDVTRTECHWLSRDFRAGETVQEYHGCTYGCVTPEGVACSINGETPFFELPESALDVVREQRENEVA